MRVHKLTFAALAVAASLSLTACQGDEDGTGQSAPSSASNAASTGGGSGSGGSDQGGAADSAGKSSGGKSAAGAGDKAADGTGKCRTDELEVTASDQSISDESEGTVVVEFKNGG
ncbi:DUF4232 domain-containing protein, partial [Streptomyces sp. NPDC001787]